MLLAPQKAVSSTYSVEVSGWDNSHSFFVEKSELSWSEETGKQLALSHHLAAGEMVFVRLLQPTNGDRAFPIAYQAEPLPNSSNGPQKFRLTRVVPRGILQDGK